MAEPFPPIEPYERGMLEVGDGHRIYWDVSGTPNAEAALVVHGGPGNGCSAGNRRMFDPDRFRVVLFDQRGCGQSTPHASDPKSSLAHNTTHHLIADMERLREHLGIERWLLYGGSWGSTLILAYAERYPERVSGIVLVSVTTTRREETDWLYRGVGRLLPDAWERFRDALPPRDRDGDLVKAYARLMDSGDEQTLTKAAQDWCTWEDAVIAHESLGKPGQYSDKPPSALVALARLASHYFAHDAWLEDGELLREAHRLAGIRGVLIHGRLDLGCPLGTAWELSKAWPEAELRIIEDSGHTGSPAMRDAILTAIASFAT
ncbi:MAG: prolyl aminopeptidase [Polyangiales bacterium]